jgi:hypothetical protein
MQRGIYTGTQIHRTCNDFSAFTLCSFMGMHAVHETNYRTVSVTDFRNKSAIDRSVTRTVVCCFERWLLKHRLLLKLSSFKVVLRKSVSQSDRLFGKNLPKELACMLGLLASLWDARFDSHHNFKGHKYCRFIEVV